jgi:hypothetical protein
MVWFSRSPHTGGWPQPRRANQSTLVHSNRLAFERQPERQLDLLMKRVDCHDVLILHHASTQLDANQELGKRFNISWRDCNFGQLSYPLGYRLYYGQGTEWLSAKPSLYALSTYERLREAFKRSFGPFVGKQACCIHHRYRCLSSR